MICVKSESRGEGIGQIHTKIYLFFALLYFNIIYILKGCIYFEKNFYNYY